MSKGKQKMEPLISTGIRSHKRVRRANKLGKQLFEHFSDHEKRTEIFETRHNELLYLLHKHKWLINGDIKHEQ
jgi:hypothetical protein